MKHLTVLLVLLVAGGNAAADQSTITEAEGYSCMGVDKSKKQTESAALQDAKRNAVEFSKTHIESESVVENFELQKDLVQAFAKADVRVITILETNWQNPADGDCYNIKIQAEVVPSKAEMQRVAANPLVQDDPTAPLNVRVWTDKPTYGSGDTMKIYVKGNKPFYGRLIYQQADNTTMQLLPNPYRQENYFQGGVIYEVPQGNDRFSLDISPPFGREKLTLYASTAPLGNIETNNLGPVYQVSEPPKQVAAKTRGIKITPVGGGGGNAAKKKQAVAEFHEASIEVTTEG